MENQIGLCFLHGHNTDYSFQSSTNSMNASYSLLPKTVWIIAEFNQFEIYLEYSNILLFISSIALSDWK